MDESFAFLPDLLIVDGGKGQLGRAVAVLERFNLMAAFLWPGWPNSRKSFPSWAKRIANAAAPFAGVIPAPAHPR